jgi:hypothetical protein
MKKLIILAISLIGISMQAQEDKIWRFGIQWGTHNNQSTYSGGSPNAHARFTQNKFDGGAFDLIARYDYNKHWMAETGLGFSSFGFGYAISENYSFLNLSNRFSGVKTEFSGVEIPFLIFYKFNPNCKNNRWLIGGGFIANFVEGKTTTKFFAQNNDATSSNYLSSTSTAKSGGHTMLRFSVGREKMFKNGSFLNASLVFNVGMNAIATSKVNYTLDGKDYEHEFTNNGNFVGLRVAYFFKPWVSFAKRAAAKKAIAK